MKYTHKQIQDMNTLADYHIEYSFNDQVIKTIEELSSLNKLLAKLVLKEIEPHDIELLDELFDSDYMIFQLKKMLVPDEYMAVIYNNVVNTKLERELKRWGLIND